MASAPEDFNPLHQSTASKKKKHQPSVLGVSMTEGKLKEFCHVCKVYFTFTNKKQVCSICELAVCKADSLNSDHGRVCRSCRRETVNQALATEHKPAFDARYAELQQLELGQASLQAKLADLAERVTVTEAEQQATAARNAAALGSLRDSLTLQTEISDSLATKLQELESIHSSLGSRVALEAAALDDLTHERREAQAESENLIQENNLTGDQLAQVVRKLQSLMGLREMKELVCGNCYCKLKAEVQGILHPGRSTQVHEQSEGHCKRCILF